MGKLKVFFGASFVFLTMFVAGYGFAQSDVVTPQDFFAQVLQAIQQFGGLSAWLKISLVITLLISSMKVTALNSLIWSKLGALQAWVAPGLALIGGIFGLGVSGPVTTATIVAYVTTGLGAVALHELLDSLKNLPGLGGKFVLLINIVEDLLGGPDAAKKAAAVKK